MTDKMEIPDKELVERYLGGEVSALEVLVAKYRRTLFGFIVNMTGFRDDPEEIFQEVWLRAIRKLSGYRHDNFGGWLVKIAHNMVIDRIRKKKPDMSLDEEDENGWSLKGVLKDATPDPGAAAKDGDTGARIRRALEGLPGEQKEVFALRMQAGFSFREIAKVQKVSINTALARMQYALVKMRAILKKDYQELGEAR